MSCKSVDRSCRKLPANTADIDIDVVVYVFAPRASAGYYLGIILGV